MTWKTLSKKTVYKNKWMTVTQEVVQTDNGDELTYGIVNKKPAVLIIPWENNQTVLVNQYRYPIKQHSWEFVQGHLEHSSIKQAASAELREESGIVAEKLEKIGEFYLAPGHHTQKYYIYLATKLTYGEQELEKSEKGMKTKTVSLKEINQMIDNGDIMDGPTIVGLKIFENYLLNKYD